MSFVDYGKLKSPSDPKIPFLEEPISFTTTTILLDSLQKYGKLIKSYRVVNNDSTNSLIIKTKSPKSAVTETLEPSTEGVDDAWTSFFSVIPNAVTGTGTIFLQLVDVKDAYQ